MNVCVWRWSIIVFCNLFMLFYTTNIMYICVFMTFSTSYCLCDTLMDIKMHVCMYICICMYVCICILTVFLYSTFWAFSSLHILLSLWPNSGFMKYVTYERMYWNTTPWNHVDTYQPFGETCCLPHHYRLQSADYSKTSVHICQSTRHHIPAHQ
jgi:hypothetical protein